jgi:rubrerythrin
MKRAFSSLAPQEALHVAIFIEERNTEIYQHFAELFAQFGDPDSIDISIAFREMSLEERHHSSLLQKKYFERYGTRPCSVTEDDVSDLIEVPSLHSTDIFGVRDLGVSPRQRAFAVAHAAETAAGNFYRQIVDSTSDLSLRVFFQEFVDMEAQHASWIESRKHGATASPLTIIPTVTRANYD